MINDQSKVGLLDEIDYVGQRNSENLFKKSGIVNGPMSVNDLCREPENLLVGGGTDEHRADVKPL